VLGEAHKLFDEISNMLTEMRRELLGSGRRQQPRLASCVLDDVPPTESQGRVRQTFARLHMHDLSGRRAEDVQLLEVPRYGGMRARLVFVPGHARL
jgi:hypothetical protein